MEYIYEARNMLSSDFCKEIIEKFENHPDKSAGAIGGCELHVNTYRKKSIDLRIYCRPEWKIINDQLERCLFSGIKEYFDHLSNNVFHEECGILRGIFGDNISITNFQIQRYEVGGHFKWHVDDVLKIKKLFGFIIYLNDNESCTEFFNGKNVKPEYGKILFFPSTWTYPHRVQEVKKGIKYIITGFICECI